MRYLVLSLILMLLQPWPALAQEPTPTVPADTGYDFQQYDFESVNTIDLSDKLAVFSAPQFINPMGSTAITIWGMINVSNVMSIFVVLLLGLAVVWWVYGRIMDTSPPTAKSSDGVAPPYEPITSDLTGKEEFIRAHYGQSYLKNEARPFFENRNPGYEIKFKKTRGGWEVLRKRKTRR